MKDVPETNVRTLQYPVEVLRSTQLPAASISTYTSQRPDRCKWKPAACNEADELPTRVDCKIISRNDVAVPGTQVWRRNVHIFTLWKIRPRSVSNLHSFSQLHEAARDRFTSSGEGEMAGVKFLWESELRHASFETASSGGRLSKGCLQSQSCRRISSRIYDFKPLSSPEPDALYATMSRSVTC
jgi:hypothetical protein